MNLGVAWIHVRLFSSSIRAPLPAPDLLDHTRVPSWLMVARIVCGHGVPLSRCRAAVAMACPSPLGAAAERRSVGQQDLLSGLCFFTQRLQDERAAPWSLPTLVP